MKQITKKPNNTRMLVSVGVFSAVALILQMIVPFPKIGGFLEIELSELPCLVISFAFGPFAGVMCELIKNLLHGLLFTTTGYVGEFANFVMNGIFCGVAGMVYQRNKTKRSAILSLLLGTAAMTLAGIFCNLYIMLPMYAPTMPEEAKRTLVLFTILPFNLIRGSVISFIVVLIYKKLSPILRRA